MWMNQARQERRRCPSKKKKEEKGKGRKILGGAFEQISKAKKGIHSSRVKFIPRKRNQKVRMVSPPGQTTLWSLGNFYTNQSGRKSPRVEMGQNIEVTGQRDKNKCRARGVLQSQYHQRGKKKAKEKKFQACEVQVKPVQFSKKGGSRDTGRTAQPHMNKNPKKEDQKTNQGDGGKIKEQGDANHTKNWHALHEHRYFRGINCKGGSRGKKEKVAST